MDVAALPEATPSAPALPPAVESALAVPAPCCSRDSAPVVVASAAPPRQTTPRPRKPRARKAEGPSSPVIVAAPRARLRLDAPAEAPPPEPPALAAGETLALVDQANETVKAAIAAASAAQQRIDALERSVLQLAPGSREQRASTDALASRADAAAGSGRWLWPLALLALALAALAVWLWSRLRALELERQRGWLRGGAAGGAAPGAVAPGRAPSPSQLPVLQDRGLRSAGCTAAGLAPVARADAVRVVRAMPTQPHAVPPHCDGRTCRRRRRAAGARDAARRPELRDVSAEELIDLEQQAEFFVVLGQDDAAIDLLVSHLRDTGGASPLPYLKLLDIYRRADDREAYERTRDRFNHRFNALAPAWGEPTGERRARSRTTRRSCAAAGASGRAGRRDGRAARRCCSASDGGELFDLPAYRELLFLYALARDLLDAEPATGAPVVDVLLPLGDGARARIAASRDPASTSDSLPPPSAAHRAGGPGPRRVSDPPARR